jgi:hypothetical protein
MTIAEASRLRAIEFGLRKLSKGRSAILHKVDQRLKAKGQ